MRHLMHRSAPAALTLAVLISLGAVPRHAQSQILHLAELNTEQIRALDRSKTVIVMPGGVLEEHGPYLPSYADGYWNERVAMDLAKAIAARPGWTAVIFPAIPLGVYGANVIGGKLSFPGTYGVKPATLRAVFMDLAWELGEQGFRWIFIVHGHGGIMHNSALDEAGDYFRDSYGGQMVHLLGLRAGPDVADSVVAATATSAQRAENGFTVHAGLIEQSTIMALRPDLVPASVANAPSVTGRDFADLMRIAAKPDWPGYFGAPRFANPELGRRIVEAEGGHYVDIALKILDGLDPREIPRTADQRTQNPLIVSVTRAAVARDSVEERRRQEWLARRARR